MRILSPLLILMTFGCSSPRAQTQPVDAGEAASSPPFSNIDEMQTRILAAHNAWRQEVGVPALQWSEELTAHAQEWANTLRGRGCKADHSGASEYGENLAWAGGTNLAPEAVVEMWGAEQASYDYAANSCARRKVCGHYTQIVWRGTETVGCAVASCSDSEVWVCNYYPAGNVVGQKPY